jgi:peptide deformylase
MSVTPIRLLGDPVLRQRAAEVVDFDAELRTLVADLTDTMLAAPGAGLAAPQLGVGLRVFTWYVDDEVGHLVNPVLELSADQICGPEGCLSIPDFSFETPRAAHVVARGMSMYGVPVVVEGTEKLARCLQHETDHLDGILFLDRLDPQARAEAMRAIEQADWFGDAVRDIRLSPHDASGQML